MMAMSVQNKAKYVCVLLPTRISKQKAHGAFAGGAGQTAARRVCDAVDRDIGLQLGQDSVAMPRHHSRRAKLKGKKIAMLETVQKANNSGKPRSENGKPGSADAKKGVE
jgi:hypothetical protein